MKKTAREVLQALVRTVEATGGLLSLDKQELVPAVDPEWLDLADCYLNACIVLDKQPMITPKKVGRDVNAALARIDNARVVTESDGLHTSVRIESIPQDVPSHEEDLTYLEAAVLAYQKEVSGA